MKKSSSHRNNNSDTTWNNKSKQHAHICASIFSQNYETIGNCIVDMNWFCRRSDKWDISNEFLYLQLQIKADRNTGMYLMLASTFFENNQIIIWKQHNNGESSQNDTYVVCVYKVMGKIKHKRVPNWTLGMAQMIENWNRNYSYKNIFFQKDEMKCPNGK